MVRTHLVEAKKTLPFEVSMLTLKRKDWIFEFLLNGISERPHLIFN